MSDRDEAGRFLPGHGLEGRDSKYHDDLADLAYEVMKSGLSKTAAAGVIGIARSTFAEWEKDHPRFSEAVKRGDPERHRDTDLPVVPVGHENLERLIALSKRNADSLFRKVE